MNCLFIPGIKGPVTEARFAGGIPFLSVGHSSYGRQSRVVFTAEISIASSQIAKLANSRNDIAGPVVYYVDAFSSYYYKFTLTGCRIMSYSVGGGVGGAQLPLEDFGATYKQMTRSMSR
jgi:type VI protein secretion system component Hcp